MNLILKSDSYFAPVVQHINSYPEEQRPTEIRGYMNFVEDQVLDAPQVELEMEHRLEDGLYFRTMHAPAGTIVCGRVHRKACLVMMSKGDISVLTEQGCVRIKAPAIFMSSAGSKRIGWVHEDVTWTTVMATNETDIEDIEKDVFGDGL